MTKDISTIEDVEQLVNSFYAKVREDDLLKDIFNDVIQDEWPRHLDKMYKFWQTILLGESTYYGSPFVPHAQLPVEQGHFDRWLTLFFQTVEENFYGEKAQEAKWRAERMAAMFSSKIKFYRENTSRQIL